MYRGLCQGRDMAQEVSVIVSDDDRVRLEAIVKARNHSHKHVQRAQIVLLSADRLAVAEVARRVGVSRPAVWRWQRRFAEAGATGLLRDKTRPPGTPPLPAETIARVVAMTCAEPPGAATHWTGRDGQRGRHLAQFGAADLGRARPPAAPDPNLQTLEQPSVCREAPGHRRAVRRSAGAQPGAVGRRKEPCVDGPRLAREKFAAA